MTSFVSAHDPNRDGVAPATGPGAPAGFRANRTPTVVLLASSLSYTDLQYGPDLEPVRELAAQGSVALLDTSVIGEATESAAYLSLNAGEPMTAPAETGPIFTEAGIPRTLADIVTDIYPAVRVEGEVVCAAYRKRYGEYPPLQAAMVHLGLNALRKAQPNTKTAARIGTLGDLLQKAGRKVTAYGDWRAAVFAMNRRGVVYEGFTVGLSNAQVPALLQNTDVVILSAKDEHELRRYARVVLPLVLQDRIDVLVIAPVPPWTADHRRWAAPGFVIGAGHSFPEKSLFLSDSTGRIGYVSNRDIVPTLAALHGVKNVSGISGSPLRSVLADAIGDHLSLMDRKTKANILSARPVLLGCGILSLIAVLFALLVRLLRFDPFAVPARIGLLLIAAFPLALLPVGVIAPSHIMEYGTVTLAIACFLVGALWLLGEWRKISPLGLLFSVTVLTLLADLALGSPMIPRSALSGVPLTGTPLRGITPPYAGLLFGAAWTAIALFLPHTPHTKRGKTIRGILLGSALPLAGIMGAVVSSPIFAGTFLCPALLGMIESKLCDSSPWTMEPKESD